MYIFGIASVEAKEGSRAVGRGGGGGSGRGGGSGAVAGGAAALLWPGAGARALRLALSVVAYLLCPVVSRALGGGEH